MSEERREAIVARVRTDGRTALADLARDFGVSEMTVRRDLDELTRRGQLRRVRGGATTTDATITALPRRTVTAEGTGPSDRTPHPSTGPSTGHGSTTGTGEPSVDPRDRYTGRDRRSFPTPSGPRVLPGLHGLHGGRGEGPEPSLSDLPPHPTGHHGHTDHPGHPGHPADPHTPSPSWAGSAGVPARPAAVAGRGAPSAATRGATALAARLVGTTSLLLDAGPAATALATALAVALQASAHDPWGDLSHETPGQGRPVAAGAGCHVITRDPAVLEALRVGPDGSPTAFPPPGVRVHLCGGEVMTGEAGLSGAWAVAALDGVHAEHAVLAPAGLDSTGWWHASPDAALWARAAAERSGGVSLLLPAAALGRRSMTRAGDLVGLTRVVVAGPLDLASPTASAVLAALSSAGAEVVLTG